LTADDVSKAVGKERDTESGLDYFGARYYSNGLSRFTSPDLPLIDQHPGDPQSWNLYTYVRNNPLRFTDPTGNSLQGCENVAICQEMEGNGTNNAPGTVSEAANQTPDPDELEEQAERGQAQPWDLAAGPPPPGVPPFGFDNAHINKLTVTQVAGVVFNENRDVQPGESTPEQLQDAKTAQAHAVIDADHKYGKKREQITGTAPWKVPKKLKGSTQFQQALNAARKAYQDDNIGINPIGGRVYFNNRFEGDDKTAPRTYHGHSQDVFRIYGPFTVGGGRVWTVIYDDFKNEACFVQMGFGTCASRLASINGSRTYTTPKDRYGHLCSPP